MAEEDNVIDAEIEEYTSIEEEAPKKKKSLKIAAIVIGIVMIVAGITGIVITVPMFFG